jgi:hypothetical protein
MLGIEGDQHVVADDTGAAAARCHRAAVGIGQRDLLIGRCKHLPQTANLLISSFSFVRAGANSPRAAPTAARLGPGLHPEGALPDFI